MGVLLLHIFLLVLREDLPKIHESTGLGFLSLVIRFGRVGRTPVDLRPGILALPSLLATIFGGLPRTPDVVLVDSVAPRVLITSLLEDLGYRTTADSVVLVITGARSCRVVGLL